MKTDVQKTKESLTIIKNMMLAVDFDEDHYCFELLSEIQNMLTNAEKLNTLKKHVNETPNNEHVEDCLRYCKWLKKFFQEDTNTDINGRHYIQTIRNFIQSKQHTACDVERLKQPNRKSETAVELGYDMGWNDCIDHLHKNGHLNTIPSDMVLVPREQYECMRDACEGINTFENTEIFHKESKWRLYNAVSMIQASEVE